MKSPNRFETCLRHARYCLKKLRELNTDYRDEAKRARALGEFALVLDQIRHAHKWIAENAAENAVVAELCHSFADDSGELVAMHIPKREYIAWVKAAEVVARPESRSISKAVSVMDPDRGFMVIAVPDKVVGQANRAQQLNDLGWQLLYAEDCDEALKCFQEALAIAKEGRARFGNGSILVQPSRADPALVSACLGNVGVACERLGRFEEALDYLREAIAVAERVGCEREIGRHSGNLSALYARMGRHEEAVESCKKALEISRQLCDRQLEADCLGNLGTLCTDVGDYEKAEDYLLQSLRSSRELNNDARIGQDLGNLGVLYLAAELSDTAIIYFRQAVEHLRSAGLDKPLHRFSSALAAAEASNREESERSSRILEDLVTKNYEDSTQRETYVNAVIQELDSKALRESVVSMYALWLDWNNDNDTAVRLLEGALRTRPYSIVSVCHLAWALAACGHDLKAADRWTDLADEMNPGDPCVSAAIADTRAWILYRRGRYEEALGMLESFLPFVNQFPEMAYHWAVLKHRLGDMLSAKEYLNHAINSPHPFGRRSAALALLEEIS